MPGHRRLPHRSLPPAEALARGPAALECAGAEAVSFWTDVTWRALVLGRAARAPELDRSALLRSGLEVHQRASGGGAVLWDDGLLSLDVMLPRGHALLSHDVVASYRWLSMAVRDGLRDAGVEAVALTPDGARALRAPARATVAAACFGTFSPWEIVVDARKVVGLCQIRRGAGGLFQVGIARRLDLADLIAALGGDDRAVAELAARTDALDHLPASQIVSAVDRRLDSALGPARPSDETPEESAAATALAAGRFAAG